MDTCDFISEKENRTNFLYMLENFYYEKLNRYLFVESLKIINVTNNLKVTLNLSELDINCDNLVISNSLSSFSDIAIYLDDEMEKKALLLEDYYFDEGNGIIQLNYSGDVIKPNLFTVFECEEYFKVMDTSLLDKNFMLFWMQLYLINKKDFKVEFSSLWEDKFPQKAKKSNELKKYIVKRSINHLNALDISIKFNYEFVNNDSIIKISVETKNDYIFDREEVIDKMEHFLDYQTITTYLMDDFDDKFDYPDCRIRKYSQLVLKNLYYGYNSDCFFKYKIVIEHHSHNYFKEKITMTKLKQYGLLLHIDNKVTSEIVDKYANTEQIYYFKESILLRAQTSFDKRLQYGETSYFFINGIYIYK